MRSLSVHDVLTALRSSGAHPLMYSLPGSAFFTFDHELRYLSAGGLGLDDAGLTEEWLDGRTIHEVLPAETAARIEPRYRDALAGAASVGDAPFRGRVYSLHLAPVRDGAGTVAAGVGLAYDVTTARGAEAALREASERNRLTFEHAPIGNAVVGLDGRWLQVNDALVELLGYTRAELMRLTFQDITHPDDLELDLASVDQLLSGEIKSYRMEKRYYTASGRTVWILLTAALVRDDTGRPLHFVSQIQDITETRRQQLALQDLTGMLAHDLRTPASVIIGFSELLESDEDLDPRQVRDHAARITASARAMTALLDNALFATVLDTRAVGPDPQLVPVREAVATAARTVDLRPVTMDVSALDEAVAWVNPVHLDQVLTNLLTNAVKYGGDVVVLSASTRGDRVRITVADNGPGVEHEFVPHLFDRYSRSPETRRGPQRGSGLGLYIVQDLLHVNGGTIHYTRRGSDAPMPGSEFTFDLPTSGDETA